MVNWFNKKKKRALDTDGEGTNCYEKAVKLANKSKNTTTEYDKEAINTIESDIMKLSKHGVTELVYTYNTHFHVHINVEKVINHFTCQGFKVKEYGAGIYKSGVFSPYTVMNIEISWR